jgi:hypothetical protein
MAKSTNHSLILMVLALAVAGVLTTGGIEGHAVLSAKAKEQTDVAESVIRWKRSYRALTGTQEKWERTYKPASGVQDLLSIVSLLDLQAYGLQANMDSLVLQTDTQVKANNVDIGLTKLCLATGGEAFTVKAASYDALLKGVDRISHRADIFVDNISILGDKDVPQAKFGELCIFLRSE